VYLWQAAQRGGELEVMGCSMGIKSSRIRGWPKA
jgi:hypothetical protein